MHPKNMYATRTALTEWVGQSYVNKTDGVSLDPRIESFGANTRLAIDVQRFGSYLTTIYAYGTAAARDADTGRDINVGSIVYSETSGPLAFWSGSAWTVDAFSVSTAMRSALAAFAASLVILEGMPIPGPPGTTDFDDLENVPSLATGEQGAKADTALQPSTPILAAPSITGRSLSARFTRDSPSVLDWDAQGAVVGGNSTSFTYAFEQAHKSGLSVRLPPSENGQSYLLEPLDIPPGQQLKSEVLGGGAAYRTVIEPAGPMDYMFELGGTLVRTGMYSLEDPNDYIAEGGAFIRTYKTTPDNLPISLYAISSGGGHIIWENDYADSVHWDGEGALMLNGHMFHYNKAGGVGNIIENVRGQGFKYGEVLDADVSDPSHPRQGEGIIFRNNVLLCTQANAIGRWVRAGLDIKSFSCTHGQMGVDGIGLMFDAVVSGKAVYGYSSVGDWIEGGRGGKVMQSRGNVGKVEFLLPRLAYGGDFDGATLSGIDFENVQDFLFVGGGMVDPANKFASAASFDSCSGEVRGTRLTPGTLTETSDCSITWDTPYVPTTRAPGSAYRQGPRISYSPAYGSFGGTGLVATVTGEFSKVEKDAVKLDLRAVVTAVGSATGGIQIGLPPGLPGASGKAFAGTGVDVDGNIGLVVAISGATAFIRKYDGSSPLTVGADLRISIEYEPD